MKKKDGISLIVLVITIVVIIILAVAVILTLSNNNPVDTAKKAKFQNDLKTMQEEVNMYELQSLSDAELVKVKYEPITIAGEDMVLKFPTTKGYNGKVKVEKGKIEAAEKVEI